MIDNKKHRCYRCLYLADAGMYVCCGYIEKTGMPRSFPDGAGGKQIPWSDTEKCPHYKPARGRWFKDVPPGPGEPPFKPQEQAPEPKEDLRKGIKAAWDYDKAFALYKEGKHPREIAKAVGCKLTILLGYINRYDWPTQAIIDKARENESKA